MRLGEAEPGVGTVEQDQEWAARSSLDGCRQSANISEYPMDKGTIKQRPASGTPASLGRYRGQE